MRGRTRSVAVPVLGIIGPGRVGVGLALALAAKGFDVRLHGRSKKPVPKPLALTVGPETEPPAWIAQAGVVILAVRDDAITPLAAMLARSGAVRAEQVVLHLSGSQGQEALAPLVGSRAALGSFHPLQTISEPERAAERLQGAWVAVEGMPRAVQTAEGLAQDLGMRPFRLPANAKAIYHAGAVFASNFVVTLHRAAAELAEASGAPPEALVPLMRRVIENDFELTGPIERGDWETVEAHLAAIRERRPRLEPLYRALADATAVLAVR